MLSSEATIDRSKRASAMRQVVQYLTGEIEVAEAFSEVHVHPERRRFAADV